MKCDACGGEVPAGAAFCSHCGAQLGGDDRATGADRLRPRSRSGSGNQPAEEELWSGTYSPKAMLEWVVGLALLTVVGIVVVALSGGSGLAWFWLAVGVIIVCALVGLIILYRRLTVRYQLTTYRLFHETGLLSRTRDRIEVIDIDDVTLTQGLIERMLDVGTIHIRSSDVSLPDGKLSMPGIEDARRVADLIDNTRRAERERRGLFLENV